MTTMSESRLLILLLGCVFASSVLTINAVVAGLADSCRPDQIQGLLQFRNEFESNGCNLSDYFNGVVCDNATGEVTELQLPRGCFTGILKPNSSLFGFNHLRFLDLSYNNLKSSSLLSEFSNLNRLEVLSLSSSGFIGQVPYSFSKLSQLSCLDLSFNHLSGTLNPNSSLFELHHLRYLDLSHNNLGRFSSIPFEFGNLKRLENLYLSFSGFLGQVPSSFSNLSRLTELCLDNNKLTGSFPLVQNLTNLSRLDLSFNYLSGSIPSSLLTMPFLSDLNLRRNHLKGSTEVSNSSSSSHLEILRLGYNQFEGAILEPVSKLINLKLLELSFQNISYPIDPIDLNLLSSLKSLSILDLSGNSISPASLSSESCLPLNLYLLVLLRCNIRQFPNFIKSLHNLERVYLSHNNIKGRVPEWLWNLPRLSLVALVNNSFTGFEGSAEVMRNSSVSVLDLASNHFRGPLPNPPHSLRILSARKNSFTGNIPLEICYQSSLKLLDLSYNNFTGSVPPCLSSLGSSLIIVSLRENNLKGSLPEMCYVGALLRTLDVGYNHLTGKLPRSLLNCSSLKFLSVENNRFKDTFPFWLKALPVLQALTLRSNKFYGPISPSDQGPLAFPELRILGISDNMFTGSLPQNYFVNSKASSSLQMNEDGPLYMGDYSFPEYGYRYQDPVDLQYKGLVVKQGKVLTSYATIDFSGNKLQGQIPESIGLLKSLIELNFSNNAFTGRIPLSLANVTELESLDLSNNQLSGTIPNGLKSLSFLAHINLSHNKLKGEIPQGTQISSQPKSSFEGNAELCGLPLEQSCFRTKAPPMQLPEEEKEEAVLNWRAVAIGYGPGLFLGLLIAQVIASYKPEWLLKITGLYKRRNT